MQVWNRQRIFDVRSDDFGRKHYIQSCAIQATRQGSGHVSVTWVSLPGSTSLKLCRRFGLFFGKTVIQERSADSREKSRFRSQRHGDVPWQKWLVRIARYGGGRLSNYSTVQICHRTEMNARNRETMAFVVNTSSKTCMSVDHNSSSVDRYTNGPDLGHGFRMRVAPSGYQHETCRDVLLYGSRSSTRSSEHFSVRYSSSKRF